jgi:hypothetical protein
MKVLKLRGDPEKLLWSDKSPDAGEPTCLCSACGTWISAACIPTRLFDARRNSEARFCDACAETWLGIKS